MSINLDIILKLIMCFLKYFVIKAMFTFTLFEILLFKFRLVLAPTQEGTVRYGLSSLQNLNGFS